jgi:hypothetical protein
VARLAGPGPDRVPKLAYEQRHRRQISKLGQKVWDR